MNTQPASATTAGTGKNGMRNVVGRSLPVDTQVENRRDLPDELNRDPRGHQGIDHGFQLGQTRDCRHGPDQDQRPVREMPRGMQPGEGPERNDPPWPRHTESGCSPAWPQTPRQAPSR